MLVAYASGFHRLNVAGVAAGLRGGHRVDAGFHHVTHSPELSSLGTFKFCAALKAAILLWLCVTRCHDAPKAWVNDYPTVCTVWPVQR